MKGYPSVSSFFLIIFLLITARLSAQVVSTNPAVPSPAQPVTITFDVTGTDFASKNLADVWLWAWLEKGATDINAPTNVNPATAAQDAAKMTRSGTNPNIYTITLTATTFFNKTAAEIATVGVLIKGRDWSNGQTADKFITFTESFAIALAQPVTSPFFVDNGESIDVTVDTNQPATIVLRSGTNVLATSPPDVTTFSHSHIVSDPSGAFTITATAAAGTQEKQVSFTYVIRTATVEAPRPAQIIDGINYTSDATTVTLSLLAPGKTSVYVLGEFNGWIPDPAYQMKKDGDHFWLKLDGLQGGVEYAFQYLVDETIKVADPYADKILDPDDVHIPETTYPGLKSFPRDALSDKWYFNRLAVLQTDQPDYVWKVPDFQRPPQRELIIYELLVRDFFGSSSRSYKHLKDTIPYLRRLGVNAIELMPVMEFNGNDSWGYNPTFMFAPDKYYGTKNMFKDFIDACHQQGIAVILDIALNHQDLPNPYLMMDFDFFNGKPLPQNRFFNVAATHPFSVFFDMNHESIYTQQYLDTINHYWLNEYKVDGFRFDLSKGFTQTSNPNNVGAWSAYDASRVALLQRMADRIWLHSPDAYVILEHLAVNEEEKALAAYRADEGKGMMLWGKMTDPYNQLTMGYNQDSDISGVYHETRGWAEPHLVGYMESHDEERLMVKNLWYGNANADYTVRDTLAGLARMRAANTIFYTIPGPKMLWQFGELGYDYSINFCPDGTYYEGCRLSPKPLPWSYRDEPYRAWLYDHVRDLLALRKAHDLFRSGKATMPAGNSLVKQLTLKNVPYTATPSSADEMNAVVVANFDLVKRDINVTFPHPGTWFDYYSSGTPVTVAGTTSSLSLEPGGYKILTDVALASTVITATAEEPESRISLYPNPVGDVLVFEDQANRIVRVSLLSLSGQRIPLQRHGTDNAWDVSGVRGGLYVAEVQTTSGKQRIKVIKK